MRVNDKIAIKAASTQRKALPFHARNLTVSRMAIRALGTIVANRNDGRTMEVEWEPDFKRKAWYFYTNRKTIWRLRTEKVSLQGDAERLRDFVWYGKEQDYDWFLGHVEEVAASKIMPSSSKTRCKRYGVEDLIAAVSFSDKRRSAHPGAPAIEESHDPAGTARRGQNIPGAQAGYALMNEVDNDRLEMVQFHQTYSYDDFVAAIVRWKVKAGAL